MDSGTAAAESFAISWWITKEAMCGRDEPHMVQEWSTLMDWEYQRRYMARLITDIPIPRVGDGMIQEVGIAGPA